jgi:hypothetical protein
MVTMTPTNRGFRIRAGIRAFSRLLVRPRGVAIAAALLLVEGLLWANLELRGRPEDFNPIVLHRLGSVSLYGVPSDLREDVGHPKESIRKWNAVVAKEGATEESLDALDHIAQIAYFTGDRQQAIEAYEKLIALPVPEKTGVHFWDLRRHLKHRACVELSDLFLESHELQLALDYAKVALTRHGFCSMCGVAVATEEAMLGEQIADINRAIAERRPVLVETAEAAFFRAWGRPKSSLKR